MFNYQPDAPSSSSSLKNEALSPLKNFSFTYPSKTLKANDELTRLSARSVAAIINLSVSNSSSVKRGNVSAIPLLKFALRSFAHQSTDRSLDALDCYDSRLKGDLERFCKSAYESSLEKRDRRFTPNGELLFKRISTIIDQSSLDEFDRKNLTRIVKVALKQDHSYKSPESISSFLKSLNHGSWVESSARAAEQQLAEVCRSTYYLLQTAARVAIGSVNPAAGWIYGIFVGGTAHRLVESATETRLVQESHRRKSMQQSSQILLETLYGGSDYLLYGKADRVCQIGAELRKGDRSEALRLAFSITCDLIEAKTLSDCLSPAALLALEDCEEQIVSVCYQMQVVNRIGGITIEQLKQRIKWSLGNETDEDRRGQINKLKNQIRSNSEPPKIRTSPFSLTGKLVGSTLSTFITQSSLAIGAACFSLPELDSVGVYQGVAELKGYINEHLTNFLVDHLGPVSFFRPLGLIEPVDSMARSFSDAIVGVQEASSNWSGHLSKIWHDQSVVREKVFLLDRSHPLYGQGYMWARNLPVRAMFGQGASTIGTLTLGMGVFLGNKVDRITAGLRRYSASARLEKRFAKRQSGSGVLKS